MYNNLCWQHLDLLLSWILCPDTYCGGSSFPFHLPRNVLSSPFPHFTFSSTIPSAPFHALQWLSARQHAVCALLQVTQVLAGQWQAKQDNCFAQWLLYCGAFFFLKPWN